MSFPRFGPREKKFVCGQNLDAAVYAKPCPPAIFKSNMFFWAGDDLRPAAKSYDLQPPCSALP
jgi:hypothetical protein